MNKKAIIPVAVISLMLLVSLILYFTVSSWNSKLTSSVFVDMDEEKNDLQLKNNFITKYRNGMLYLNNPLESSITIQSVKVGDVDCSISTYLNKSSSMQLDLSLCLFDVSATEPEIVILTDKSVFSKKIYKGNAYNCPTGYIPVSGNSFFGTSIFCVMKYEAKNIGGIPTSQASDTPWVSINVTNARAACEALGSRYHLMTHFEKMTIARDIEQNGNNWNSSVYQDGFVYIGHNDNDPASLLNASNNDSDGYYRTNNVVGSDQRRTFYLSSGKVIWDFAGNVGEILNDTEDMNSWDDGQSSSGEWSSETNTTFITYAGPINYLNSGLMKLGYRDTDGVDDGESIVHGGYNNANSGIYNIRTTHPPSAEISNWGFRCTYNP